MADIDIEEIRENLTQSAAAEVVEAPRLIDTVLVTRSNRLGKGNDGK